MCGYVITAVLLTRTRRGLRQSVSMDLTGRVTFDTSLMKDVATTRPPTVEEQVATLEQLVSELANSHRDLIERIDTQALKTQAALAEQAVRPLREFLVRESFEAVSICLFVLGVALSVIGTLN